MQRRLVLSIAFGFLLETSGCAGPLGPPLGPGAGMDQLGWLLIAGVLFAALYRPLRRRILPWVPRRTHPLAEDTARERYARGELTREEYLQVLKDLRSDLES